MQPDVIGPSYTLSDWELQSPETSLTKAARPVGAGEVRNMTANESMSVFWAARVAAKAYTWAVLVVPPARAERREGCFGHQ